MRTPNLRTRTHGAVLLAAGLVSLLAGARPAPAAPVPPMAPGGDGPGSWHWPLHLNLPESVQRAYPNFRTDREVAEAWFRLHAIKGQEFDVP